MINLKKNKNQQQQDQLVTMNKAGRSVDKLIINRPALDAKKPGLVIASKGLRIAGYIILFLTLALVSGCGHNRGEDFEMSPVFEQTNEGKNETVESKKVDHGLIAPPIDLAVPQNLATATLALG